MAKGKRLTAAYESVDTTKAYPLPEAIKLVKQNAKAKFDETVEMSMNLGIDPRHADQMVRGLTSLPNGTGKTVRVGVFARGPKAEEAQAAGADVVGAEDLAGIGTRRQGRGLRCLGRRKLNLCDIAHVEGLNLVPRVDSDLACGASQVRALNHPTAAQGHRVSPSASREHYRQSHINQTHTCHSEGRLPSLIVRRTRVVVGRKKVGAKTPQASVSDALVVRYELADKAGSALSFKTLGA